VVALPVVAEWWRGRTDAREAILGATSIVASLEAAKAAGIALSRLRDVDARMTIDAVVMATAALLGAVVLAGDMADFGRLAAHFPGVTFAWTSTAPRPRPHPSARSLSSAFRSGRRARPRQGRFAPLRAAAGRRRCLAGFARSHP
jgi:hypothetical protein